MLSEEVRRRTTTRCFHCLVYTRAKQGNRRCQRWDNSWSQFIEIKIASEEINGERGVRKLWSGSNTRTTGRCLELIGGVNMRCLCLYKPYSKFGIQTTMYLLRKEMYGGSQPRNLQMDVVIGEALELDNSLSTTQSLTML